MNVIGKVLMLFIIDLIGAALITPIATAMTGAGQNLTDNAAAQGMVSIITLMFVIVLLVVNAVVIMEMLHE